MSSSASLSCLGRPFVFLGDLVGESPCGMAEAELGSTEAHGVEGAENVGQGVVSGEGGRAARGSLDGDIGNAVKARLTLLPPCGDHAISLCWYLVSDST